MMTVCMYVWVYYYVYTPMTTPASSEVRTRHRWGSKYSSSHAWSWCNDTWMNMNLVEFYYRNWTCSDMDLQWRRECIIACSLLCGERGCCCSWCVEGVMSTCSSVHTWTAGGWRRASWWGLSGGRLSGGWLRGWRLSGGWLSGLWFVELILETGSRYTMILQHLRTWNKHALYVYMYKITCTENLCTLHRSSHALYTLHLDMDTRTEWSWTFKPLNSSPGVSPHCSPSLECSTCAHTVTTI